MWLQIGVSEGKPGLWQRGGGTGRAGHRSGPDIGGPASPSQAAREQGVPLRVDGHPESQPG